MRDTADRNNDAPLLVNKREDAGDIPLRVQDEIDAPRGNHIREPLHSRIINHLVDKARKQRLDERDLSRRHARNDAADAVMMTQDLDSDGPRPAQRARHEHRGALQPGCDAVLAEEPLRGLGALERRQREPGEGRGVFVGEVARLGQDAGLGRHAVLREEAGFCEEVEGTRWLGYGVDFVAGFEFGYGGANCDYYAGL